MKKSILFVRAQPHLGAARTLFFAGQQQAAESGADRRPAACRGERPVQIPVAGHADERRTFVARILRVGYRSTPVFFYRPLDTDPLLLKRRLLKIGTERVDDPTLAHVLRQTQLELDRQLTMLGDIGTARFLPGSLQVFGRVDSRLAGTGTGNPVAGAAPR